MTTIAFDGKTLAADKQATNDGLMQEVTKIFRIRDHLCAAAGDLSLSLEMLMWFRRGADPADLPATQRTDSWVGLLAITPTGRILKYERSAYPIDFTQSGLYASGSGRDFAISAMRLGSSAKDAVLFASKFDAFSGLGVDELSLD